VAADGYLLPRQRFSSRSTYIHGSYFTDDQRKGIQSLEINILNYARIILSVYIQKWTKIDTKDGFIARIDNAILDDVAKQRLSELLEGVILP
jgi:hypothetical protein